MQHPFRVGDNETVMWNSLCIVDTGIVVAVGGVNSNIEMIKGYPVKNLQAPYAHPTIDGKLTRNEGYFTSLATQILLGVETGTRTIADFAYDNDSLYFITRVTDKLQNDDPTSYSDGVTLLLDCENESYPAPSDNCCRIFFQLAGSYVGYKGSSAQNKWIKTNIEGIKLKKTTASTYYILEAAIPWKAIGVTSSPSGKTMRANIILQDRGQSTTDIQTESIPDAKRDAPYTWMEFYLRPNGETGIESVRYSDDERLHRHGFYDLQGRQLNTEPSHGLYIKDGKKIAR
jgi:hypothetical protein